jgi:hypothetical protein
VGTVPDRRQSVRARSSGRNKSGMAQTDPQGRWYKKSGKSFRRVIQDLVGLVWCVLRSHAPAVKGGEEYGDVAQGWSACLGFTRP